MGKRPERVETKTAEIIDENLEDKLEGEAIKKWLTQVYSISGDDKMLIDNIQILITNYGDFYNRLGTWHGKSGSRDFNISKTSKAHTTLITDKVISTLDGRIEALNVSTKYKKETLAELERRNIQYEQEVNDA